MLSASTVRVVLVWSLLMLDDLWLSAVDAACGCSLLWSYNDFNDLKLFPSKMLRVSTGGPFSWSTTPFIVSVGFDSSQLANGWFPAVERFITAVSD